MKVRPPLVGRSLGCLALGLTVLRASAGALQPQGLEAQLTRGVPGDQVFPSAALTASGGFLAWQDAAIDGDGLGIAAVRVSPGGASVAGSSFRVNETTTGDQEAPSVAALASGGAVVVWQGGQQGFQRVFGRFFAADGRPITGDIAISAGNGRHQIDPALAVLADGSVVVAWSSYRQDQSFSYDVFARRLSAAGAPLGDEFRVNATAGLNRRSPAVAATTDGGFLVAWITERQAGVRDGRDAIGRPIAGAGAPVFAVTLAARAFAADGTPWNVEQTLSDPASIAANPVLAALGDGRVAAAWTRRSPSGGMARYDVAARFVGAGAVPATDEIRLNDTTDGDQFRPRLAATRHGVLAVWSSLGQDGSADGVIGRWIDATGAAAGDEVVVNSQNGGAQIFPAVASAPDSTLLVAWSSNLPRTGYELFAQRFAPLLLRAKHGARGSLGLQWPTVPGGVYRLQMSRDGQNWADVGGTRTAVDDTADQDVPASEQMVLYRVVRVR